MLKLLFVTTDKDVFNEFVSVSDEQGDVDYVLVDSGEEALKLASKGGMDLVVADEELGDMTGLELAHRLLSVNPMINCILISSLSTEDFHVASEGVGLLDPLPVHPDKEDARKVLERLRQIKKCMNGISISARNQIFPVRKVH